MVGVPPAVVSSIAPSLCVRCRFERLAFVVRVKRRTAPPEKEAAMRYMFTIVVDEAARESATEAEIQETGAAYGAYTQEVQDKGILVAGEGLQPASTAT